VEKYDKNINTLNLGLLGAKLQYIPLETRDECLINEIRKILFTEEYIFVDEAKRLLQFDRNGKFIRQVGAVGRGPQEYLFITDFCIYNNEIYILENRRILIFDFAGNYKRSINLPFRTSRFLEQDSHLIFYQPNAFGGYSNPWSWVITDTAGSIIQSIRNNNIRKNIPGLLVIVTPLYNYKNQVRLMDFCFDTLYVLDKFKKKPYAIFNFGAKKMELDPIISQENGRRLIDRLWIRSVFENDNFLFIKFMCGISDSTRNAIFNKKTEELTFLKNNVFINDLDGGVPFQPRQMLSDDILIDYIDAFSLIKFLDQQSKSKNKKLTTEILSLRKKISELSNPILVIVKD
jgi:hypothetical protein